jgi:peptide/nickel transport system substrate-binding protein
MINLYDTLVYPTPGGGISPHAAESWEVSPDYLSYTFEIRKGIKFHDGHELTAEDVKFSMDRLLAIGEGYAYLYRGKVASTEVLDEHTVRFNLEAPFGPFITALVRLYILDKECVLENTTEGPYGEFGDYGKEYLTRNDSGSGPYTAIDVKVEQYVLMERFTDYWGEISPNAPDQVKFMKSPDPVTVKTLMRRGELEFTDASEPMESYEAMDQMDGVDIGRLYTGGCHYLMLHNGRMPTDDIHFRKALSWLFDYDEVVSTIFPGTEQASGPVSRMIAGHQEGLFQYHKDLDKAREELRKSKYYDQLDEIVVVFGVNSDVPAQNKLALLLQADAAKVGVNIELVNMPWATIVDVAADKEKTPNMMYIAVSPSYPEAGAVLQSKYHSSSAGTWEQTEWVMNPLIDQLIEDALITIDRTERFEKYGLIQEIAVAGAFSIFVLESRERHGYQSAYLNWPQVENQIPVMGYEFDCRFIEVFPEKRP